MEDLDLRWEAVYRGLDRVVIVKGDLEHPVNQVPFELVELRQRFVKELELDPPAVVVGTVQLDQARMDLGAGIRTGSARVVRRSPEIERVARYKRPVRLEDHRHQRLVGPPALVQMRNMRGLVACCIQPVNQRGRQALVDQELHQASPAAPAFPSPRLRRRVRTTAARSGTVCVFGRPRRGCVSA